MQRHPTVRVAAFAAMVSIGLAACSDDATTAAGTTTSATSTSVDSSTTIGGTGATAAFCASAGELVAAIGAGGDPSEALMAAIESAPPPVGEHLGTLGERMGEAGASGDEAAFLADEVRSSARTALGDIASTCDYQTADTSAGEYAFAGLPSTLDPGPTAFRMTNDGSEVHEMLVFRRAEGTEGDLVDIVNDDPTVSDGRLEEIGVMLPAAPGEQSVLLADLLPGDYVAVCFLPQGVTTVAQLASGDQGSGTTDHRSLGMITPFTVD